MPTLANERREGLSALYHALRARRRRQVIAIITRSDKPEISVQMLARTIAATEHGTSIEHATGEPYRNPYNALSQTHLPTSADVRIINYDSDRRTAAGDADGSLLKLTVQMRRLPSSVTD